MATAFDINSNNSGCNSNLLINGDFAINQMESASYTLGSTRTYTVDQWSLFYNAQVSNCTITPIDGGGVTFSCTASGGGNINIFGQDIEKYKALRGKVVTLSMKLSSVSGTFKIGLYDGENQNRSDVITQDGITSVTMRVPSNCSRLLCFLTVNAIANHSCTIEWAKLEIGSTATTFCPPDPAVELLRCQRFFYILKKSDNYTEYGIGHTTSNTTAIIFINVPSMRITPTLLVSDNADFSVRWGQNYIGACSAETGPTLRAYTGNTAVLQFTTKLAMSLDYTVASLRSNANSSWIAFDARQY